MMRPVRAWLLVLPALLPLALGGCGGTNRQAVVSRTTSQAREISDLQAARAAGVISDAEYQAQLARLNAGP